MTGPAVPPRPSIRQIADLLTWARRLAEQPFDVDPRERTAFHQAKIDLLARINDDDNTAEDGTDGGGV
jgi:hypothetical protein